MSDSSLHCSATQCDVPHVLTVDLEDWFHCLSREPAGWSDFPRRIELSTRIVLDILDECNTRATFFVLGDVAKHSPDLVARLVAEGHEVGTHGMNHRFVYQQTQNEFREDLLESIDLIAGLTKQPVCSYRAPYFSITEASLWALPILQEAGIRIDSSVFPTRHPWYGIAGAERLPHEIRPGLWEWPVSPLQTAIGRLPYAGGAYFRFLPWLVVRAIVSHLERRAEPILFYIHPWELDPDQPVYRTDSRFLNFRHYYGLNRTADKLRRLLKMTTFTTLRRGMEMMVEGGRNG